MRAMLVVAILLCAAGCGGQQFQVLHPDQSQTLDDSSQYIVDGTCVNVRTTELVDIIFGTKRWNEFDVAIDRVIKGDVNSSVLHVHDYRSLSAQESDLIPGGYGIIDGIRLRLAFDGKFGDSFRNLRIVPLGMTPQLKAVFELSESLRQDDVNQ